MPSGVMWVIRCVLHNGPGFMAPSAVVELLCLLSAFTFVVPLVVYSLCLVPSPSLLTVCRAHILRACFVRPSSSCLLHLRRGSSRSTCRRRVAFRPVARGACCGLAPLVGVSSRANCVKKFGVHFTVYLISLPFLARLLRALLGRVGVSWVPAEGDFSSSLCASPGWPPTVNRLSPGAPCSRPSVHSVRFKSVRQNAQDNCCTLVLFLTSCLSPVALYSLFSWEISRCPDAPSPPRPCPPQEFLSAAV